KASRAGAPDRARLRLRGDAPASSGRCVQSSWGTTESVEVPGVRCKRVAVSIKAVRADVDAVLAERTRNVVDADSAIGQRRLVVERPPGAQVRDHFGHRAEPFARRAAFKPLCHMFRAHGSAP